MWTVLAETYVLPHGGAVLNQGDTFEVTNDWTDDEINLVLDAASLNHVQQPLDGGLPPGRPRQVMKQG